MTKLYLAAIFFILTYIISAPAQEIGNIPSDWFELPEDNQAIQNKNIFSLSPSTNATGKSFDAILKANLIGMDTLPNSSLKNKTGWHLSKQATVLGLSGKGLIGLLGLKGSTVLKLIYRRKSQPQKKIETEASMKEAELILNEEMSYSDLEQQIAPLLKAIKATGKISKLDKFKENLLRKMQEFQRIASSIDYGNEKNSKWFNSGIRVILSATATGSVNSITTAGGTVKVRLDWQRVKTANKKAKTLTKNETENKMKNNLQSFIRNMLTDLDSVSEKAIKDTGWSTHTMMVGTSVTAKGTIAVATVSSNVSAFLIFKRNPNYKETNIKEKSDSNKTILIQKPYSEKYIEASRKLGINYEKSLDGNNLIFKVPRSKFIKGLKRSMKISRFFLNKANKHKGKNWELYYIKSHYTVSVSGTVGLVSLTGAAELRVFFIKN